MKDDQQNQLLKTIYVPKNIMLVSDRLPKSNYVDISKAKKTRLQNNIQFKSLILAS